MGLTYKNQILMVLSSCILIYMFLARTIDNRDNRLYRYFNNNNSMGTTPIAEYDTGVTYKHDIGTFLQHSFVLQQTRAVLSNTDSRPLLAGHMEKIFQNKTCRALYKFPFPDSVQQIKCADLFKSPPNETELSRAMEYKREINEIGFDGYKNLTQNCTQYVLDRGYILEPVNEEEANFPLAFSILIYRDVEQVERLLRAIYRPQNYYCIHVDKKVTQVYEPMSLIAGCLPHVFMSDVRYQVSWGTVSILQPEIQCMKQLLAHRWRYFINLTGMEFPLKTNWELVQILKAVNGGNLIAGDFYGYFGARVENRWVNNNNVGKYEVSPPQNITLAKGFAYLAATWDFVNFTIQSDIGSQLLEWVTPTKSPEETFFATLNMNPQFGVPGAFTGGKKQANQLPEVMRYAVWALGGKSKCPFKSLRRRYNCLINVELLPRTVSSEKLIANKFLYRSDQVLAYDCMEELILKRTQLEYCQQRRMEESSLNYYRRLGYSRNHLPNPSFHKAIKKYVHCGYNQSFPCESCR